MAASGCHTPSFTIKLLVFILLCHLPKVFCWDNDDLELFDIVEEVDANFYEVLEVSKSASASEIKKAYRKKTLILHPDKNEAADAEEQFRKLVAVYDVLKDKEKRERYDAVLENGLPDWRQPVYYYRKARKLGLLESALILGLVITIGQYFVLWASYLEKRLSLESFFESKLKKSGRKADAFNEQVETDMQEELKAIPKPKLTGLWPFTITLWVISIPAYIREVKACRQAAKEREEMKIAMEKELELEKIRLKEEIEQKKQRKKNRPTEIEPVYVKEADVTPVFYGSVIQSSDADEEPTKYIQRTGEWTDEDYVNLSKAYIKFPGGTAKRWEKIAEMVGRPLAEVCDKRSKEMKGNMQMNLSSTVQGSTKSTKKPLDIKDEIMSTAECETITSTTTHSDSGSNLRKRNKPTPKDSNSTDNIKSDSTSGKKLESHVVNGKNSSQKTSQVALEKNSDNKTATQSGKLVIKKTVDKTESKAVSNGTSTAQKSADGDSKMADSESWSQNQQVVLEWALKQYPKGTEQRWEKIADQIPGKKKEECIARFKHLAKLVKQKKQSSQS